MRTLFPVMVRHGRVFVPWAVGVEAWQSYALRFTGQTAERIAERGGFGDEEMDLYRPGWREFIVGGEIEPGSKETKP